MIHHVSIPAHDPEHVAGVLAELLAGYAGSFVGPIAGAWVAYAEDAHGTGVEVYPESVALVPGVGDEIGRVESVAPPQAVAFHALISVKVDRATVERIGAREGWRVVHSWRGPPGVRLFELYELWVENRVMLEIATEDMIESYLAIANGAAQRALLSRARPQGGAVKRRTLGRLGIAVLGAVSLFAAWVYGSTEARLRARYDVRVAPLAASTAGDPIARGEHVVRALAKCSACHAEDLGGRVIAESPLLGRLSAPNLTAGPSAHRSDEALIRALIHGVSAQGRPLVLMPSHEIAQLSDADLAAVVAYLRTVPPVARQVPPLRVGPLYRLLLAFHRVELSAERVDHSRARASAPAADPASAAYGEYLAKTGGCFGCHGASLAGGAIPACRPARHPPRTSARERSPRGRTTISSARFATASAPAVVSSRRSCPGARCHG